MLRKRGSRWVLMSKDGKKRLGSFSSKAEAEKRERQIQYFKHAKK